MKITTPIFFSDRTDAGQQLARKLTDYADHENVLVLGMVRGGLVVAAEVAIALKLPLDIIVCRKIGAPWNAELGVGALRPDGKILLNEYVMQKCNVDKASLAPIIEEERRELARRLAAYRGDLAAPDLKNKTVILVDDGIATGSTIQAALAYLRDGGVAKIIIAAPIIGTRSFNLLRTNVDEVVAVTVQEKFEDIADFYQSFPDSTDKEVMAILDAQH